MKLLLLLSTDKPQNSAACLHNTFTSANFHGCENQLELLLWHVAVRSFRPTLLHCMAKSIVPVPALAVVGAAQG